MDLQEGMLSAWWNKSLFVTLFFVESKETVNNSRGLGIPTHDKPWGIIPTPSKRVLLRVQGEIRVWCCDCDARPREENPYPAFSTSFFYWMDNKINTNGWGFTWVIRTSVDLRAWFLGATLLPTLATPFPGSSSSIIRDKHHPHSSSVPLALPALVRYMCSFVFCNFPPHKVSFCRANNKKDKHHPKGPTAFETNEPTEPSQVSNFRAKGVEDLRRLKQRNRGFQKLLVKTKDPLSPMSPQKQFFSY